MASILIVEDDRVSAAELARMLDLLGHRVAGTARTFAEAMQICAAGVPDLALLDINLDGDRDGIAVAMALREVFDVAIAFISGHADPRTLMRAAVARPNGYLIKPFGQSQVDALVHTALANFEPGGTRMNWAAAPGRATDRMLPEVEQRIRAMIADDAIETGSRQSLASAAGVDGRALAGQIKAAFGQSPRRLLAERRLAEAKRLLRDTALPLAEVAAAAGYADQPHMTKAFRKAVGTTPAAYRRALTGNLFG